mgnify:CR=1 FL=1
MNDFWLTVEVFLDEYMKLKIQIMIFERKGEKVPEPLLRNLDDLEKQFKDKFLTPNPTNKNQ